MTELTRDRHDQHVALDRILAERWTCRQFLPESVPQNTVDELLRLAQRTPSWANTQPWEVIVTSGAGHDRFRKELLAHVQGDGAVAPDVDFPAGYEGVHRERRRDSGLRLYESIGVVKGDHEGSMRQFLRNFEFFDAPHVAIITTEAGLDTYGAVDCGLYINTFLLAAHSLGLAAAPQAALASYSPFLREYFGIPEGRRVLAGISFGYADVDHPINSFRTTRADLDAAVTWHVE